MKNTQRTNILPVIPLRGKVAFPHTTVTFEVGREMTLAAIQRANEQDKLVLICSQRVTEKDEIDASDLYETGCVAQIKQAVRLPGGVLRVSCEGLYRAKAREIKVAGGHFSAVCDEILPKNGEEILQEAYFRTAKALVKDVLASDGKISKETVAKLDVITSADEYIERIDARANEESLAQTSANS